MAKRGVKKEEVSENVVTQEEINAQLNGEGEPEKRPYVIILMSQKMKDAIKEWADANNTNPTELGRKLFAETVGYDLAQEPAPKRRSKFASDTEREEARKHAAKKSAVLRKALFQAHIAQLKKRPELEAVAHRVAGQVGLVGADLDALDAELSEAMKAGR